MCASVNNIHANVSNTRTINLERLVSLLVASVFLFTTSTYSEIANPVLPPNFEKFCHAYLVFC